MINIDLNREPKRSFRDEMNYQKHLLRKLMKVAIGVVLILIAAVTIKMISAPSSIEDITQAPDTSYVYEEHSPVVYEQTLEDGTATKAPTTTNTTKGSEESKGLWGTGLSFFQLIIAIWVIKGFLSD